MSAPRKGHITQQEYDAIRKDRDLLFDTLVERQKYIRQLEEEIKIKNERINELTNKRMKDQQTTGGTTINNYGTYIAEQKNDIHDNHNCQIYTCPETTTAEDVKPTEPTSSNHFRHITQKCINENRADSVEAEIRAACKGTAEGLWRTLWNNENLGYVVVQPIDATTLYRDIENHFGELPFKERQFRSARNKR